MDHKFRRVYGSKLRIWITILGLVFAVIFLVYGYIRVDKFMHQVGLTPKIIYELFSDQGKILKSNFNRTNILVMGIGGGDHDGADLTDTMIVLSIDTSNGTMALISIPRDIWSDTLKDKINSAYHYGEQKKKGGGIILAKAEVEDVIGLPIQYGFLIDFSGFKNLIDQAGGVDVNVTIGFTDNEYPIEGKENDNCNGDLTYACRYQTVTFTTGFQRMDGTRALIYVRSRHADSEEGSDFARSRRQQEVLIALKDKLTKPKQLLNIKQNIAVVKAFDAATDTDMSVGELLAFAKYARKINTDKIQKITIDKLFITPPAYLYDGRFVLTPADSYTTIKSYIKTELDK